MNLRLRLYFLALTAAIFLGDKVSARSCASATVAPARSHQRT